MSDDGIATTDNNGGLFAALKAGGRLATFGSQSRQ